MARDLLRHCTRTDDVLIPDASGIEIIFDLIKHAVVGETAQGEIPLGPMSVAEFHTRFRELV